jgi:hypothetical protein
MKKINILGLLMGTGLLFNLLPSNQPQALSQPGGIDFNLAGDGCNSTVDYNPRTKILRLKPGLKLNAYKDIDRITCLLRVTSTNQDLILVPVAVKGSVKNRGGQMTVSITTNSGANILSTLKRSYNTSGGIDAVKFFEPSENPQCGSSGNFGANISVFGTNASVDLNDIQFQLQSKRCL